MRGWNSSLAAWIISMISVILLSCNDPGATEPMTEDDVSEDEPPEAPVLELSVSQVKQFDFEWMPAVGAQYYQLFERVDVGDPYVQVGEDLLGLTTSLTVPLHARLTASYQLLACNDDGCTKSEAVDVVGPLVEAIGYFKPSNRGMSFGEIMALSGDGNTLAVSSAWEASGAMGIDGDQADNSAPGAGAVYVFVRDGQSAWSQQAYIKASNTDEYDHFGSVALSEDGSTLAVGASGEDGNAIGIGGNQAANSASNAGAVYVFVRDGQNAWSQQAYVKASNTDAHDQFANVALSGDGNTLAVGAFGEASNAIGIGGNPSDNSLSHAGAVYLFVRDGQGAWSQQAYLKASNTDLYDFFGETVELSGDGNTLAVGASGEASNAMGIDGNQADNSASDAGAVYVFVRDGQNAWSQQAYVKASNTAAGRYFGESVALAKDGNTLAVGATRDASNAMGMGGDQADNSAVSAGAVYVFVRDGQDAWSQQAYLKASNTDAEDLFGYSVGLAGDGSLLAVGAVGEGSHATGIGGDQADDSLYQAGAVYVFARDGQSAWSQQAYVKASNTDADDYFGSKVVLSGDGDMLAVGAFGEASTATGVGGNQADNSGYAVGAVYVY